MIYTCTLNPSIDYIMHVDHFENGGLNRATNAFYYPGGKGINVSRVMNRLGTTTTALGFTGQFTGEFIKNFLDQEGVAHQFIDTEQYTRINVKLKSDVESEINGPGPELSNNHQSQLLNQIEQLTSEDILVVAGSVPSSLPEDFYNRIAAICTEKDISLAADTSGKALKQLIGEKVLLLKPNHHELGQLFDTQIESPEKAAYFAKKLVDQGAQHVIVSMGGNGAVFVDQTHAWFANVPTGSVKNSVGAGDSVVSGFLTAYTNGRTLEEAFKYGVASGSATAFQDDLCEKEDVERLLPEIKVVPIT
ncbi:1-phosphofructokinase [Thalassobacillus hwangdonensis]|uniref:Tagatose-6-phosphate kinase n=1 Tax=Thalassobacillus hwangdonensis TaxID=546108 RepID=A0ABW3L2V7_9BACI